jgi:hypothetical protein
MLAIGDILYRSDHAERPAQVVKLDAGKFMNHTLAAIRPDDAVLDLVRPFFGHCLSHRVVDPLSILRVDSFEEQLVRYFHFPRRVA